MTEGSRPACKGRQGVDVTDDNIRHSENSQKHRSKAGAVSGCLRGNLKFLGAVTALWLPWLLSICDLARWML